MMKQLSRVTLTLAVLAGTNAPVFAQEVTTNAPVRVIGANGDSDTVAEPVLSDVERYCSAIADPARDARNALQAERLNTLEGQISTALDELEAKRAEYEEWLAKRQAFLESTSAIMLDIYATMRPDAAAAQLAGLDRETAASIIANMKSRQASSIMSEMPAPVASELAGLIVQRTDEANEMKSARAPISGTRS